MAINELLSPSSFAGWKNRRSSRILLLLLTLTFGAASHVHATLIISASVAGAPTGAVKENFDTLVSGNTATTLLPSGITISFRGGAEPISGSSPGVYVAPFLSGRSGSGFGAGATSQAGGVDTTVYVTTGSTGTFPDASVTLQFPSLEESFGILWGSVDSYDTLAFYNGAVLVRLLIGGDVIRSPKGDQGVNGTEYVNVTASGGSAFNRVVATSSQYAFEFDDVSFTPLYAANPAFSADRPQSLPASVCSELERC